MQTGGPGLQEVFIIYLEWRLGGSFCCGGVGAASKAQENNIVQFGMGIRNHFMDISLCLDVLTTSISI